VAELFSRSHRIAWTPGTLTFMLSKAQVRRNSLKGAVVQWEVICALS
jgi:hypothetical protein